MHQGYVMWLMSELYIIDGNNLLHTIREQENLPGKWNFEEARHQLSCRLREFAGESGAQVTLVYDGTVGGAAPEYQTPDFKVLFATAESTADTVIEQLVENTPRSERVTVVTSDRLEQYMVKASGAFVTSCRNFILQLNECRSNTIAGINRTVRQTPRATMGDIFPDDCGIA